MELINEALKNKLDTVLAASLLPVKITVSPMCHSMLMRELDYQGIYDKQPTYHGIPIEENREVEGFEITVK